jgi:hypothetical protein
MKRMRNKPFNLLVAAAVLALVVALPVGLEVATADPGAASRANPKQQLKRLERKLERLQRQVAKVSKQPGPRGPAGPPGPATGPAGGDLAGTYPNPLIGPDAVGSAEIEDGTVTGAEIATGAVGGGEIANDVIQSSNLGADSVGSSELKGVTTVTSPGSIPLGGLAITRSVTCPPGQMVIGGGYAWRDDEPNEIIFSRPSETDPNQTWVVRGMELGAGSNALYAWANCLLV